MNFKYLLNSFHWTQSMHLTLPQVSAFQKSCWKSPPAWRELRLQPATPKGRHALAWELTMYRPVCPLKLFLIVGASSLLWHHLRANFHSTIQDCIFPLPKTPEPHCYHHYHLLPSQRRNRKEGKVGLNKSCCFQTHATFPYPSRSIPKFHVFNELVSIHPLRKVSIIPWANCNTSATWNMSILGRFADYCCYATLEVDLTPSCPKADVFANLHHFLAILGNQVTRIARDEKRKSGTKANGKTRSDKKLEQHWTTKNNHLKHETTIKVIYKFLNKTETHGNSILDVTHIHWIQ